MLLALHWWAPAVGGPASFTTRTTSYTMRDSGIVYDPPEAANPSGYTTTERSYE